MAGPVQDVDSVANIATWHHLAALDPGQIATVKLGKTRKNFLRKLLFLAPQSEPRPVLTSHPLRVPLGRDWTTVCTWIMMVALELPNTP